MIVAMERGSLGAALAERPGGRAVVMTMGALHSGHAALMAEARRRVGPGGIVVVTIFVNPLQFGANEDLDRYPRSLDDDLDLCRAAGADVVFTPSVDVVYPGGEPQVTIDPGRAGIVLEGAARPGHFRGVLTVVAKLIGMIRPDIAVFGEKDYQQVVLIQRMARDLDLGVEIVAVPTARDADGVSVSSRNRYLTSAQRAAAGALPAAIAAGRDAAAAGAGAAGVAAAAEACLTGYLSARGEHPEIDYVAVVGPDLGDSPAAGPARLVLAARIGGTRLIDNAVVDLGSATEVTRA